MQMIGQLCKCAFGFLNLHSCITICIKKIIQLHLFYHKDACKIRLNNFLYTYDYTAMQQVCLDRPASLLFNLL